MDTEHRREQATSHAIEVAWTFFAAANMVAMFLYPSWMTVPFHLIWVSFALLYGLRAWGIRATVFALVVVGLATGALIVVEGLQGKIIPERAVEVPLMTAMFAAMVWHVRRYLAAMQRIREVSTTNQELLDREHRFVQHASHELRTPITVALGHAELLARSVEGEQDVEDATVVVEELMRLRLLTSQLLSLATLTEEGTLAVRDVALGPLLEDERRRWAAVERRWVFRGVPGAAVRADPDRLRAALDALVDNAVKHTDTGGRIELVVQGEGSMWSVSVNDDGWGIDPEAIDHVFDQFVRAGPPGGGSRDGFGLGLALVRAVAESHGGWAGARSGEWGSSFTLALPAAAAAPRDEFAPTRSVCNTDTSRLAVHREGGPVTRGR